MGKTENSKTYHTSQLIETAIEQLKYSYTPYSGFKVGAALLAKNGTVYTGCNIENAAYTPTNCAERTAFFKAVSEGVKEFDAICIVGGKDGVLTEYAPPCGVCRQVMMEFCDPEEFQIILATDVEHYDIYTLKELLPLGFGPGNLKENKEKTMTIKELTALPKVELHCHLDGSLSRGFIEKRLGRKVLQSELSVSEDCRSLNEYLEKFDLPGKCIMDETGLKEAGYDVLKSMKQENVCYAEIRFAPLLSETPDMNCNKVIEALLAGLEKGKRDFGVEYGVITCAMRHHSEEENARMLRTAREYLGHGVCAADLAGAESLYPMSEFMELFKKTKALGMPFTLHAGECGNVQNILDSVEAGAGRIGHGIAMRGHADVQKELQKKGIGIEMCPISNLQTKAVGSTKDYPMREFLNARLKVTVNTDNRTVSNTTLTKELEFIQKTYGITDEEIHLMMRNAVDVAFADDAVKERMLKYV